MRAVNLIPRDRAHGSGGPSLGSGAGVYVLLAGLAGLVVCAALWASASKQAGERQDQLDRVQVEAAAAERRAGDAAPYVAFSKLARDRVQTVTTLSNTRFDWANAMREIGRVLPADVWLVSLVGSAGTADSTPSPTTTAAPAPTVTLVGCTRSQAKVAGLMARLRTIDGVRRVALKSSEKPDSKGDASCPANRASDPRFTLALSFAVPGAPKSSVDATGQVAASASASAASGAAAPPAATPTAAASPAGSDSSDG